MAQLLDGGGRALAKSKTYSIINIAGLAIGMAACIMILLYIRYEQSYDRWLPDVENTYQLQTWYANPDDGEPFFLQMASYVTRPAAEEGFPAGRERSLPPRQRARLPQGRPGVDRPRTIKFADDDFLKVVNLPLAVGDDPVSSADGRDDPVTRRSSASARTRWSGRTLTVISSGEKRDFKITGVLKDMPKNSHMKINAILRMDFNSFFAEEPQFLTCWGCQSGWVYAKLKPGTDPEQVMRQMPAWEKRNIPDEYNGDIRCNSGDQQDWHLVNLQDVHLGKAQDGSMTPGNDQRTIATFAVIALLILGMAVVNFTNLATARASQRAREVALRKVLGANRKQLIVQFVGESILISAASMLLALALVELLVKPFAAFLDADLALNYFGSGRDPAAGDRADPAGRHRQRPLSRLLPVAVPAGAGAQGQPLGRRNAGFGPAAHRAGDRPVRGVDRAHHLHGRDLRPDRLRPLGRSGLQARQHPPGRRAEPRPAVRQGPR